MELYLAQQAKIFLIAVVTGAVISLIYDVFRIIRIALPCNSATVVIEDILFCFIAMCISISFFAVNNSGQIRGYLIFGMVLGAVLCHMSAGSLIIKISKIIISIIKRILLFIATPFKFIFKVICKFSKKFILFLKKHFIFYIKQVIIIKDDFKLKRKGGKTGGKKRGKKNKFVCKNSFCNRYRLPALRTDKPSGKNIRKANTHK